MYRLNSVPADLLMLSNNCEITLPRKTSILPKPGLITPFGAIKRKDQRLKIAKLVLKTLKENEDDLPYK